MKDFAPLPGPHTERNNATFAHFWRQKFRAFVVLAAALAVVPYAARAVDLVNRDRAPQEVIDNHSSGRSETLTVKAGEKVADICADCVVLVGTSSVEVKGPATVKIERGKVSVDSRR